MKLAITILILLSAAEVLSAQETFPLYRAIEKALEHNHNVRISEIETEKAERLVTRGNAGQLPALSINSDLNWSYSNLDLTPGSFFQNLMNPEEGQGQTPGAIRYSGVSATGFNAGLGTQFVIYDGMKGRLRYRMLETGNDLAGLQHRAEMENTVLNITGNYIQAASLQKVLSVKELALKQSHDRYQMVETRREYGQASEQQLLQALADLQTDSTEFRNLQLEFENAYRDLHTAIGWNRRDFTPLEEPVHFDDTLEYDELLNSLLESNTALSVRQRRIDTAELDQKLARSNFLPKLTASAKYEYSYQHATDGQFERQEQIGFMGGVSLRIPIFTGGRNKTASQNAKASIRQEQIRYEESEQQLRTQFENSWQKLIHFENQFATEQSNLTVFERNFERAKDSFDRGVITGVELRSAQLSLQNARLRLSETEYQLVMTKTTLLFLSGRLVI